MIEVLEKPENVSWEAIRECVFAAHSENRQKGILMSHYLWSAEKIKNYIGDRGKTFVAMDDGHLVATASFIEKAGGPWYAQEPYAFLCLAGILPEYRGRGIYKQLMDRREREALEIGYKVLVFDTNKNNRRVQELAIKDGFRYVNYTLTVTRDHFNVVLAKWPNGCPYSSTYCNVRFFFSKIKAFFIKLLVIFRGRTKIEGANHS